MVGTVAGDGAKVPVSSSFFRSPLDSRFSISDNSLVGLRPFSLPLFQPARAIAVLAALLPQLLTYDHRFTVVTVGGLGSEARFQVKKSACFWCHGRYHE